MLQHEIMIPYVLGHVTGRPNNLEYVTCTDSLRIEEIDQMPDGLDEPWGWYKILLSDGRSWVDVTMINWDVIELYNDPFIYVRNENLVFSVK